MSNEVVVSLSRVSLLMELAELDICGIVGYQSSALLDLCLYCRDMVMQPGRYQFWGTSFGVAGNHQLCGKVEIP
jgi:hypothetical protein